MARLRSWHAERRGYPAPRVAILIPLWVTNTLIFRQEAPLALPERHGSSRAPQHPYLDLGWADSYRGESATTAKIVRRLTCKAIRQRSRETGSHRNPVPPACSASLVYESPRDCYANPLGDSDARAEPCSASNACPLLSRLQVESSLSGTGAIAYKS
jgi:hypothetical protein